MPTLKPGTPLAEDQMAFPIVWFWKLNGALIDRIPLVADAGLELALGPGRARAIKSWGHDADGVHWLVTRSGTGYHTDPAYARYTHHLIIRNDCWRIRGFNDDLHPSMLPGAVYCLDTHSPHQVVVDERIEANRAAVTGYKVQVAVDRHHALEPEEVEALLVPWIGLHPEDTAATATHTAPRYNPPN